MERRLSRRCLPASILVAIAVTTLPALVSVSAVERKWGTAEAAARLDEMQEELNRQEELVERLRKQLPSAQEEQTCHVSDQECRRQEKRARRRKGRKSEEREEPPSERFKFSKQLDLPKSKMTVTKWLLFPNANEPQQMSTMLVSGDAKGTLHFFSSDGNLLVSHPSGLNSAITAIAVHKVHDSECVVVAASEKGGIRSFSITRPPRFNLVIEERKNKRKGPLAWQPLIRQIADFMPSTAPPLDGVKAEKYLTADMSGAKAIPVLEVIAKGKSYNILAVDAAGRVSMHLRNGTTIGALRVAEGQAVLSAAASKGWTALGTSAGVLLYDNKWRRLANATCMGLPAPPDAAQVEAEEAAAEGGDGEQQRRRRRRPEPVPLVARIESLHAEATATQTQLYAGTGDGRALVLQVRGSDRGGRLLCTVLHDLAVLEDEAGKVPVSVAGMRGFLLAGASTKSVTALHVFNATAISRTRRPSLFHYLPLEVAGVDALQLATDQAGGLAVAFGRQLVLLYQVRLPYKEPSSFDLDWLNLLRHPAVLGGLALLLVWRMRSGKKKDAKKPLDFGEAGRNKDIGSLGGLLKGRGAGAGRDKGFGMPGMRGSGSRVQWEDEGGRGMGGGMGGGRGGGGGYGGGGRLDEEEEYDADEGYGGGRLGGGGGRGGHGGQGGGGYGRGGYGGGVAGGARGFEEGDEWED